MGKKKGLAAIFSSKPKLADASPAPPWPWPSCATAPETASFHLHGNGDDRPCTTAGGRLAPRNAAGDDVYKTVNSVYFDSSSFRFDDDEEDALELDDGASYSTATASEEWSEAVIRSLGRRASTDRLFFDSGPPPATNSILAASRSPSPSPSPAKRATTSPPPRIDDDPNHSPAAAAAVVPEHHRLEADSDSYSDEDLPQPTPASPSPLVDESVAVALDSSDPYADFRASMEEMVAAHGLRDWADLEELLSWYLRINGKHNHRLIVGAFVDLLVGLASRSPSACATTTTVTMTTTTATATTSSGSSSSTTSSVAGGASCSTSAATIAEDERYGICGADDASCFSPAALSSEFDLDEEEDGEEQVPVIRKDKASRDDEQLALRSIKLCALDSSSLS